MLNIKQNLLEIKGNTYISNNQKFLSGSAVILQALILIAVGIIILNLHMELGTIFTYVIATLLISISVVMLIKNMFNKNKKSVLVNILEPIFYMVIGIYFLNNPDSFIKIFPLIFTGYIAIDVIIKTINTMISFDDNLANKIPVLLRTIVSYVFLVILLVYPMFRLSITVVASGIYFIILGVTYFIDAVDITLSKKNKDRVKKKIRLAMPVFVAAFIPFSIISEINKLLAVKNTKKIIIKKEETKTDVQVLVHVKNLSAEKFGHVDIAIDDKVYSYGSYDENKIKFKSAIGDGVLFEVPKDKYIEFCTTNENKSIIEFGLKLNTSSKKKLLKAIKNIKLDSYVWKPRNQEFKTSEYSDYSSRLYVGTGAKFNKFKRGPFKTYFTLFTNCVKLVDVILADISSDILTINGLVTPGTYYDHLNRQFRRKNTIVVSKEIHLNQTNK